MRHGKMAEIGKYVGWLIMISLIVWFVSWYKTHNVREEMYLVIAKLTSSIPDHMVNALKVRDEIAFAKKNWHLKDALSPIVKELIMKHAHHIRNDENYARYAEPTNERRWVEWLYKCSEFAGWGPTDGGPYRDIVSEGFSHILYMSMLALLMIWSAYRGTKDYYIQLRTEQMILNPKRHELEYKEFLQSREIKVFLLSPMCTWIMFMIVEVAVMIFVRYGIFGGILLITASLTLAYYVFTTTIAREWNAVGRAAAPQCKTMKEGAVQESPIRNDSDKTKSMIAVTVVILIINFGCSYWVNYYSWVRFIRLFMTGGCLLSIVSTFACDNSFLYLLFTIFGMYSPAAVVGFRMVEARGYVPHITRRLRSFFDK